MALTADVLAPLVRNSNRAVAPPHHRREILRGVDRLSPVTNSSGPHPGANRSDVPLDTALERVLARFGDLLRASTRARGLSANDADEIIQDVRVRLWKTGASDEKLDGLGASYLQRVVTSAVIDLLRRRRAHREESLDLLADAMTMPEPLQVAPADPIGDDDLARRLELALAHLPRNRRLVVQLHLEGYHRTEIAELMGWTEGKVRNLLYRGLEELRSLLGAPGPHETPR